MNLTYRDREFIDEFVASRNNGEFVPLRELEDSVERNQARLLLEAQSRSMTILCNAFKDNIPAYILALKDLRHDAEIATHLENRGKPLDDVYRKALDHSDGNMPDLWSHFIMEEALGK